MTTRDCRSRRASRRSIRALGGLFVGAMAFCFAGSVVIIAGLGFCTAIEPPPLPRFLMGVSLRSWFHLVVTLLTLPGYVFGKWAYLQLWYDPDDYIRCRCAHCRAPLKGLDRPVCRRCGRSV